MPGVEAFSSVVRMLKAVVTLALAVRPYLKRPVDWVGAGIGIAAFALIVAGELLDLVKDAKARRTIASGEARDVLRACVAHAEEIQHRVGKGTLRASVMTLKRGKLRIVASYRMDDEPDRDIEYAPGQGCCGHAFDSGRTVVGDIGATYKDTWEETCKANDGRWPWGITKQQYEMTREIEAVLSIPIKVGDQVKGVLNLDDKIVPDEALFKDDGFVDALRGYVLCLRNVMKGGSLG
ncbi:MAG: GAF domain-containing protein [Firmicutes bacterium]|nr:GAF domain-containing protein [Bacillota bacterium]